MPEDFPQFLIVIGISLPIGVFLGLVFLIRPELGKQWNTWTTSRLASRRWWVFVLWATIFLFFAWVQFTLRRFCFSASMAVLAAMELILMVMAIRRRAKDSRRSTGG